LIDRRSPFHHRTVHGDSLPGPDEDLIPGPETVRVDTLFDAIAPPHSLTRGKSSDSVDGSASAKRTPLLKEATQFKEEWYQRGSCEGTRSGRSKNSDGDQLVRRTARVSSHYSAEARYKRRDSYYGCCQTSTKLADLPLVRHETHE
jgi:hypothetical protein